MKNFVKIIIEDENHKILEHHYIRKNVWGVPAGKIENDETPQNAATRELLERSGFAISPNKLEVAQEEDDFYVYRGKREDLKQVSSPGEKGGYETSIRWN